MRLKSDETAPPPPEVKPRAVIDPAFMVLLGLSILAAVLVALLKGPMRVWEVTLETLGFLAVLAPKVMAGVFIAATLPMALPKEKVAPWVGRESGLWGLFLATAAGAAIPGGPMMTFPLAAGFVVMGADAGAIIAFVSGWSLLGLNRTLIWEFSFLPAEMVWIRYGLSLCLPLLMGLAARAIWAKARP